MDYKFILTLFVTLFAYVQASSSEVDSDSDSSSVASSASTVDSGIRPACLECPPPKKIYKSCGKKKKLYLTERTCYSCPQYKCVKKKYFKEGRAKFCLKILPTCRKGCDSDETCFISVQTFYKCSKAKCVPKLLGQNQIIDMEYTN